jgi:ankyrin repeat protein
MQNSTIKDKTRSGKIALHFCAESGNCACTDLILAADLTLKNAQDEEGYTPLHLVTEMDLKCKYKIQFLKSYFDSTVSY